MTARSIELACGWWLAALLVVAAAAKLVHPADTRRSFGLMGVRAPEVAAIAVPMVELAVAVTLLLWPPVGGGAAIVLLVAFTVVLVRVVRSGSGAPCACFGAATTAPVGRLDVVRNLGLLALGLLAWLPSSGGWPGVAALLVVGAVVAAAAVGLRSARRRLSSR